MIRRQNLYIACEELNFVWDEKEVIEIDRMWNTGASVWDIAKDIKRPADEVSILILDRARRGFIKNRIGGAIGRRGLPDGFCEKQSGGRN